MPYCLSCDQVPVTYVISSHVSSARAFECHAHTGTSTIQFTRLHNTPWALYSAVPAKVTESHGTTRLRVPEFRAQAIKLRARDWGSTPVSLTVHKSGHAPLGHLMTAHDRRIDDVPLIGHEFHMIVQSSRVHLGTVYKGQTFAPSTVDYNVLTCHTTLTSQ
jgi:hypothetical protein